MREHLQEENGALKKVICNQCGRELKVENGYLKEECFSVDYRLGYFSNEDGCRHQFDLCEACYREWIKKFKIPVKCSEEHELM